MKEELIAVVDENDAVIDAKPKSKVMEESLTHRGSYVFLLNSKNQIFIHQRASTKKIYPLYWGIFVGGFVSSGENYEEAAVRELREEVGICADELEHIGDFRYKISTDDWFGKLYRVVSNGELKFQLEEIQKGYFIQLKELDEFVKTHKIKPSDLFIYEKFKNILK